MTGCSGCKDFAREWETLKLYFTDIELIHIHTEPEDPRHPILTKEYYIFPMIILTTKESYYSHFTQEGELISSSDPITGIRYNAVEDNGKYVWGGRPFNACFVISWVTKQLGSQNEND